MALFVPLNVTYYHDEKIMRVGGWAELLYVRSLAFCKANSTQGAFTLQQCCSFGAGIPRLKSRREALVLHSLWEPTDDGWFICGWFNHNKADSEISEARRDAGLIGQPPAMASRQGRNTVSGLQVLHRKCDRVANRKTSHREGKG